MSDPLVTLVMAGVFLAMTLLVLGRVIPDEYDSALPVRREPTRTPKQAG
jgi:hypothetical protein